MTPQPYSKDDLVALAKSIAAAHHLQPELVCAVVEQESNWNPWAIRYEDGFYNHYVDPTGTKRTSTESRAEAFSWGLGQVMGGVARELGYKGNLAALCDPPTGLEYLCRKLEACLGQSNQDISAGLQRYNGGGNPSYSTEVMARMAKYK